MKRTLKSFLCIIMALCCLVPASVFAAAESNEDTSVFSEITNSLEPTRSTEIQSLREVNSKTYEMSDGTYQCVVYAEDIHYEDANGILQEIDNTIKTTSAKSGYSFTNTANSWYAYFADKLSQNNAVSLEKDDYSVSFSLVSTLNSSEGNLSAIGTSTAPSVKKATQLTATEKSASPYYSDLSEDNRAVLYKDVLRDVDISYTVKTGHLKEDIIVKSASAPTEFNFKLNLTGVTPVQVDENIVFNNSKGKTVFELAPMYMIDANGKYSEEIAYSLEEDSNGYILTITADPSYFRDSKTAYPVIIDPSVMISGESNTYDTCVDEQYPTNNYYLRENLWTGGKTNNNTMRTFIKFDIPTNIVSNNITSAYVRIKKKEHLAPTIKAYRVTSNWSSNAVTWNDMPGHTTANASSTAVLDTGAWYKMTVTSLVKLWRNGTYSNYGFCLREPSETNASQKTQYYSSDAPSPNKPELVINYSGSATAVNSVSVRKITDETYREEYSSYQTKINNYMSDIDIPFSSKWNISFTHYSWVNNTTLPSGDCTLANNQCCHDYPSKCGSRCSDDTTTPNHHKNHYRNWYTLYNNGKGSADITIGFFGFNPCAAGGLSLEWLSTVCQPNLSEWTANYNRRTLQHEISHLFGCDDGVCTSGQSCIMSGGFDNISSLNQTTIWCTRCSSDFNRSAH